MQLAFVANELKEEQALESTSTCSTVHRKCVSVLAAAVLAAFTSTATLAADDISGVAIGSSLADAKAAIAKANPDYQLNALNLTNGQEAGVTAVTQDRMPWTGISNPGGPSDEFVALRNDAGKVWFIARIQRFDQGGRIKAEALKDALVEKFGKPSAASNTGVGLSWAYDRDGKQWDGTGVSPCKGYRTGGTNIPGVSVGAPESFNPSCGKFISAGGSTQPDGMVPHYVLSITDSKAMFDELTARDAKEEADRKQKLADEQAKAVKPKI